MLVQRSLGNLLSIGLFLNGSVFLAVYVVDVVLFVSEQQVGLVLRHVVVESGPSSASSGTQRGELGVGAVGLVRCG